MGKSLSCSLFDHGLLLAAYHSQHGLSQSHRASLFLEHLETAPFGSDILFVPLVATIALIHYFSGVCGSAVYLLTVPVSVFAIIAHKIHIQRSEANLQRLEEQSRRQMSIIETLALGAISLEDDIEFQR